VNGEPGGGDNVDDGRGVVDVGSASGGSPRRTLPAALTLSLVAAVAVSSPLHLPLNNPNEGVRVFATRALVEYGTPAIDAVVRDWGYIDDKAERGGRLYSSKAPFVTLVAAAAYAVVRPIVGDLDRAALTRFCRLTGSAIPTAMLLAVAFWALRRRCRDAVVVDLAIVGIVVGSGVLATLHVFSGHALAAAAGAALGALALLDDVPSPRRLLFVGATLSAAACAEYPAVLLGPLVLPVVRRHPRPGRALLAVFAAALLVAVPTLVLHSVSFGAPWRTGYSFLENAHYQPLVQGTLMGVGWPDRRVLATVLFSPAVGLFFFAPLCAVGVVAARRLPWPERLAFAGVVIAFRLFIAGFRGWRGGWSVGPRYLSELWGVLGVAAAVGLDGWRSRFTRPVLVAAVAIGIVHSGIAGALFPHLPDLLENPVGELVLPLVVRGIAPDSVPLALGMASSTSVMVIVAVLALPLFVAVAPRAPAALLGLSVVVPVVLVDLTLPGTDAAARGREVRRALDNWRPETGVPYLVDGADDPRVLFAIDRGRRASSPACPEMPVRPRRPDLGPGADVLRRAALPDRGLVVVHDALADAIAPHGGGALIVTVRDLAGHLRGVLPCTGDIIVVARARESLPVALQGLPVGTDDDLGGGWRRLTLGRIRDGGEP
jgi:hypothetical protein